jgi:hypothetical protein
MRTAATTPMPSSFDKNEIGLMTASEFLKFKNKDDKSHSSDSYDLSLKKLNYELEDFKSKSYDIGWNRYDFKIYASEVSDKSLVYLGNELVAVLHKGTMYYNPISMSPDGLFDRLGVSQYKQVKYISEYKSLVFTTGGSNKKRYPVLLQNIKIKGEPYQVRAESTPKQDAKVNLAVMNRDGEVVAVAQNEWGATLIVTAREYRGLGLGQIIGKYWYELNPNSTSGGFTQAGKKNALKLWESRVKEFSENGWYSELVKSKKLSVERLKQILSGTSGIKTNLDLGTIDPEPIDKKILVYSDDVTFLIYDSRFAEDQDEKYVHAYGFLRENDHGLFYYTFDYDPQYRELATKVALQMVKDQGQWLSTSMSRGSDLIELDDFDDLLLKQGQQVMLKSNLLPLKQLSSQERKFRKPIDQYGEVITSLLETAESKW